MDNPVPKKNQPPFNTNTFPQKGEPTSVGGQPSPHLEAGGTALEGLRAANTMPQPPHLNTTEKNTIINDLHKKDQTISSIRTFESDAVEATRQKNISAVSLAAQQIQKKDNAHTTPHPSKTLFHKDGLKKIVLIVGILVLIVASIGIVGYAIFSLIKQTPLPQQATPPKTLITADDTKIVSVSPNQNTLNAWLDAKHTLANDPATIVAIDLINSGTTTPVNAQMFLTNLGASHMPSWFIRAIGQSYMTGFYHDGSSWNPFLIVQVDSYTNAFAGMLQWEPAMATDLAPLYASSQIHTNVASTTIATTTAFASYTASSTSSTTVTLATPPSFSDTFIDNKNVRVLGIPGQKPLLLYSFPEQNVLVITTSTAAMKEIFNRLVSYQFSN